MMRPDSPSLARHSFERVAHGKHGHGEGGGGNEQEARRCGEPVRARLRPLIDLCLQIIIVSLVKSLVGNDFVPKRLELGPASATNLGCAQHKGHARKFEPSQAQRSLALTFIVTADADVEVLACWINRRIFRTLRGCTKRDREESARSEGGVYVRGGETPYEQRSNVATHLCRKSRRRRQRREEPRW